MRRQSEPLKPLDDKIVTASHVTSVPANSMKPVNEQFDEVAYKRNMEGIFAELQRPQPRHATLKTHIELTFNERRAKINSCTSHTTQLIEEYPFFKSNKWVSKIFSLHVLLKTTIYVLCICCIQVLNELDLMFGNKAAETVRKTWKEILPGILSFGKVDSTTHDDDWMTLRAMQVMDKKLKTSGPAARSISAFSVYEVCIHEINLFFSHSTHPFFDSINSLELILLMF